MSDKRPFIVGADSIELGNLPNGNIGVALNGLGQALQLAGDLEVVLALSPEESVRLGLALERKGREALNGSPLEQ